MSLLGSRKFWKTKLRLRARLSYISGFCYYLHTALFTFVAPLVPLTMLVVFPHNVGIVNYGLIAPSVLYNLVLFPLWHQARYRLDCWTVKMVYGWAHVFAIWDIMRGRRMGWQATGGSKKKHRTRRLWMAMRIWTAGTGLLWAAGAAYRLLSIDALTFTPLFLTGMFYLTVVGQALLVDPVQDRAEVLP
jgi:cellulose synthase (UDP-forming)